MESDNGARTVSPFNITSNIEGIKIYSGLKIINSYTIRITTVSLLRKSSSKYVILSL